MALQTTAMTTSAKVAIQVIGGEYRNRTDQAICLQSKSGYPAHPPMFILYHIETHSPRTLHSHLVANVFLYGGPTETRTRKDWLKVNYDNRFHHRPIVVPRHRLELCSLGLRGRTSPSKFPRVFAKRLRALLLLRCEPAFRLPANTAYMFLAFILLLLLNNLVGHERLELPTASFED